MSTAHLAKAVTEQSPGADIVAARECDPASFAEAFLRMQQALPRAIKEKTNPAFKSKYADLSGVWDAVSGPLHENGFVIHTTTDFSASDTWIEMTLLHTPTGQSLKSRYPLRPTKNDPQGYGSAITYARRYCLSALLGVIADEDDDGNAASRGGSQYITEGQAETIFGLMKKFNVDRDRFLAYIKVKSVPEILAKDFGRVIEALNMKEGRS